MAAITSTSLMELIWLRGRGVLWQLSPVWWHWLGLCCGSVLWQLSPVWWHWLGYVVAVCYGSYHQCDDIDWVMLWQCAVAAITSVMTLTGLCCGSVLWQLSPVWWHWLGYVVAVCYGSCHQCDDIDWVMLWQCARAAITSVMTLTGLCCSSVLWQLSPVWWHWLGYVVAVCYGSYHQCDDIDWVMLWQCAVAAITSVMTLTGLCCGSVLGQLSPVWWHWLGYVVAVCYGSYHQCDDIDWVMLWQCAMAAITSVMTLTGLCCGSVLWQLSPVWWHWLGYVVAVCCGSYHQCDDIDWVMLWQCARAAITSVMTLTGLCCGSVLWQLSPVWWHWLGYVVAVC